MSVAELPRYEPLWKVAERFGLSSRQLAGRVDRHNRRRPRQRVRRERGLVCVDDLDRVFPSLTPPERRQDAT